MGIVPNTDRLTEQQEDTALEMCLNNCSFRDIARGLGFKTDLAFYEYRQRNPVFENRLKAMREAACDHLEDDLLGVADVYDDHKVARVKMESIARVLGGRMPQKWGQRVDVNLNQTLNLGDVLNAANQRLNSNTIDVTPSLSEPTTIVKSILELPSSIEDIT